MFQLWIVYLRSRGIVLRMIWTWSCTQTFWTTHGMMPLVLNTGNTLTGWLLTAPSFWRENLSSLKNFRTRHHLPSNAPVSLVAWDNVFASCPSSTGRCPPAYTIDAQTHSVGVDPIFPSKIGIICRTLSCSLSSLFLVVIGLNQNVFWTVSQVDYFEQILFTERFVIGLAWSILVQFLRTPLFLQRIGWLSQLPQSTQNSGWMFREACICTLNSFRIVSAEMTGIQPIKKPLSWSFLNFLKGRFLGFQIFLFSLALLFRMSFPGSSPGFGGGAYTGDLHYTLH